MTSALRLYGDALLAGDRAGRPMLVRMLDGESVPVALGRYLGPADQADRALLDSVDGPVLDVGCGPGRHLHALAARGIFALGVDLSPVAVELAVQRGGRAIVGDVFDDLPGARTWRTMLLLDGNIGIGGAPARLLSRLGSVLEPHGEVLVELDPPGVETRRLHVRLEADGRVSPWFPWARVSVLQINAVADAAGLRVAATWRAYRRWFASLRSPEAGGGG